MKIAIASDHAGFTYKEKLKEYLRSKGHEIVDFGTDSTEPVDYPGFIRPAAEAVADRTCERAIVLGGSGNGEAIVSNKVRGVRCIVAWDAESARLGRAHNDANVISIGERMVPFDVCRLIIDTWLAAPFDGGRHQRRIDQIEQ